MTTSEVLRAAKDYLAVDPSRWLKGGLSAGESVCASGACGVVVGWRVPGAGWGAAVDVLNSLTGGSVSSYNDCRSTTYADILALFDRAIALEEAAEEPQVFPSEWVRTEVPA